MDDIRKNQEEVIITKRGKPVIKLIPIEVQPPCPVFGYLKGTVAINSALCSLSRKNGMSMSKTPKAVLLDTHSWL